TMYTILSYIIRSTPNSTLFPYTTLFRSQTHLQLTQEGGTTGLRPVGAPELARLRFPFAANQGEDITFGYAYLRPEAVSAAFTLRSEEHTSELQSRENLVCRLLLEKKNIV